MATTLPHPTVRRIVQLHRDNPAMSRAEIARRTGCDPSTVSRILNGERRAPVPDVVAEHRIEAALITARRYFERIGHKPSDALASRLRALADFDPTDPFAQPEADDPRAFVERFD